MWPSARPENRRAYYHAHRQRILRLQKPYRRKNRLKIKARSAKWRKENPHKHRGAFRNHISERAYKRLMKKQNNLCAVCGLPFSSQRLWKPVIDHDHKCCPIKGRSCGKCIRGIVHSSCNLLLGYASDSPKLLRGAAEYLLRYKEKLIVA